MHLAFLAPAGVLSPPIHPRDSHQLGRSLIRGVYSDSLAVRRHSASEHSVHSDSYGSSSIHFDRVEKRAPTIHLLE